MRVAFLRAATLSSTEVEANDLLYFTMLYDRLAKVACVYRNDSHGCIAITPLAKLVYAMLARRLPKLRPTMADLARDLGVNVDAITRAMKLLVNSRLVEQRRGGDGTPSSYRLTPLSALTAIDGDGARYSIGDRATAIPELIAACGCDSQRCGCGGEVKRNRGASMPSRNTRRVATLGKADSVACGNAQIPHAAESADSVLCGRSDSAACGLQIPQSAETVRDKKDKTRNITPSLRSGVSAPTVFRGENDGVDFSRQQTREQAQPNHETATDKPILNEPNLEARAAASRAAEVAVQVAAGLNALGLHNATRRGVRAELDRAAEVLLNVAVDLVFKHGSNLGFTRKQWENLNRRIAREMAEARTTPEMLASAMNVYYTHPEFSRWAHMHRLEIIRDRLPQLLAIASGTNQKRKPSAYAGVEKA